MRTLYLFAGLIAFGFAAQNKGGIKQMLAEKNLAQTQDGTPPPPLNFTFTCDETTTVCGVDESDF